MMTMDNSLFSCGPSGHESQTTETAYLKSKQLLLFAFQGGISPDRAN